LLKRRFEEAINLFLEVQDYNGANEGISSGLADAYHQLAFQTLADQVRISVRSTAGNKWMFRIGHPVDQPLKIHPSLIIKDQSYRFISMPSRVYASQNGLKSQRMERHFLPRHGLSGRSQCPYIFGSLTEYCCYTNISFS